MPMMKKVCAYAKMEKCSERGCGVKLEKSYAVYCGEKVSCRIMEKNRSGLKMFDCIIANRGETEISAVELKNRKGKGGPLKGRGKAGDIDRVRGKFTDGLIVLRRILERIDKSCIRIQLILYTKGVITNTSELALLSQPLDKVTPKLRIIEASCGDDLPNEYVLVSVDELHQQR